MDMIGPYRILDRIGGGQNTRVFAGEADGDQVAIKLFTPSERRRKREVRRGRDDPFHKWCRAFEWEADLLTGIEHPAIIPILARGFFEVERPYFTMPLFADSLAGRMWGTNIPQQSAEPLEQGLAVGILRQILDGLHALHDRGIVHRDVKPQNILIDEHSVAVLCDLGQAISASAGEAEPVKSPGTFPYVAPELRDPAAQPDGRADIYALGLVAHLMLVGRLPREGEPVSDTIAEPALAEWVKAALDPDPAQRPNAGPANL